jgi:hypothetical protein
MATIQTRINEANQTWEMLVYKNERAMSFELFCQKIQKALQHFERAGRAKYDGDVIDWIWNHIQNPDLVQTVAALKAAQSMAPRSYNQILQELAKEIPNLVKTSSFSQKISEITRSSVFTFNGKTPSDGAFTSDGKLFCGSYPHKHWFSEDMTQHRDEIKELRDKHQPEGKPQRKHQVVKHQSKVKELKKENEQLLVKLASLKSGEKDDDKETPKGAGESFGGCATMKPT